MAEQFEEPILKSDKNFEPPIVIEGDFEEPIKLDRVTTQSPIVPQGIDNSSYVDIENIFAEYGRKLTKEDILEDDRLMEVVRSNLEARFTPGGVLTKARRGATGVTGGAIGGLSSQDYREMSDDKVFEVWQNYQRSFAGGQTVTTGNEIAYGMSSDDSTKVKLGAGYLLFDQMDNAFTGEGSWAEMGDAIWDYSKSAVYDPSTILSLGLGKLFGFTATKASGAVARNLMTKAYQQQVKKGVAKKTALGNVGKAVATTVPYATADAIIGAGVDVAYQAQLIDVGVQKEYEAAQTALAAAGALVVIPALKSIGVSVKEFRKSDIAPQFLAYKEFDENLLKIGAEEAKKTLRKRVKKKVLIDAVDDNFGLIKGSTKDFLAWPKFREKAKERVAIRNEKYSDDEVTNAFFQYFFLGDPDGKTKGYYQALKEAGFVVHKSMLEEVNKKTGRRIGISGVFGQSIKFLSVPKVKQIVKKFEKDTGYKLNFMDEDGIVITGDNVTPVSLASHFARQASLAGESLWLPSHLSRLEKSGVDIKDAVEIAGGKAKTPDDPKRVQYIMSVYKRLLTSHLATTGANVKGFTQLVSINSLADFFTAAINLGQSGIYKLTGNKEAAEKYMNRSYGSAVGAVRRGVDVLSPDIPMEYADKILSLNPKVAEKLFRDVSGDGGVRDALSDFNLDKIKRKPGSVLEGSEEAEMLAFKGLDAVTKGAQTLTMVRLQDELTKRWAFGTNLNQAIMREYGMTFEQFFDPKKANFSAVEMASDRFQNNVLDKAAFRTLRETASVNWSTLPGKESLLSARTWAKGIEAFTNRTPLGFIVPFGSFLNTTVATMSDLVGINALRFGVKKISGKELDFATREGAESLGKMAAGWSLIATGIYVTGGGKDRIENNLAYNQDMQPDGSVQDKTYDWPVSTMRLLSQIGAHGLGQDNNWKWSEVPPDLWKELAVQVGGQAVRDLDETGQTIIYASEQAIEGNFQPLEDMLGGARNRVVQGASRPLDPINQVWGMVSDSEMNPDRRQGAETQNQMLRYINNVIGGTDEGLPRRATPTRGRQFVPDIGKQILGNRTLQVPNLIEKMMNAAGRPYWKSVRFDGPAEIKNKMDALAAPFFETRALEYLKKNPDYFRLPLSDKQKILDTISTEVKKDVTDIVKTGMPKSINVLRTLSGKNKKEVRNVMKFLGIEGNIEDLLKEEGGLQQLLQIQSLVDSYDDIFYGDLNLD
mgnify:FL=1